ncbi:hypothetical protein ACPA9J_28910 [Pseudomonas aeruginosa]
MRAGKIEKSSPVSSTTQQHHRLHAFGADRGGRTTLRHAVEPGGQPAFSGTSLDDAVNQPVFLAFPSLKPFLPASHPGCREAGVERVERVTWALIDTPRHYALTFYPLMGGTGRGAVIRIDDITQRLSLEEVMVQSEKMLSVGSLAAGMTHEINNPLGAILHNVQNIKRRLSPGWRRTSSWRPRSECRWKTSITTSTAATSRACWKASSTPARGQRRSSPTCSPSRRRSHRQMTACELPALLEQAVEIAGNDFDLAEGFDFRVVADRPRVRPQPRPGAGDRQRGRAGPAPTC